MLIGVISDTHRNTWVIDRVLDEFKDVDLIIHLGDNVQDVKELKKLYSGRVLNVKGNCDYSSTISSDIIEEIGEKVFFITHGHNYDVKNSLSRLKEHALSINADIVLFGHTHIAEILYEDGIWFINPGSPVLSRDNHNSVAIIKLDNNTINPSIKAIR